MLYGLHYSCHTANQEMSFYSYICDVTFATDAPTRPPSAGEYASAIETLVTAISLIKQSKVSSDERCKILISSLQDTLHGIEAKSYGRKDRGTDLTRHARL